MTASVLSTELAMTTTVALLVIRPVVRMPSVRHGTTVQSALAHLAMSATRSQLAGQLAVLRRTWSASPDSAEASTPTSSSSQRTKTIMTVFDYLSQSAADTDKENLCV